MGGVIWIRVEGDALYPFLSALRVQGIRCGRQRCVGNSFRAKISAGSWKQVQEIAAKHHLTVTVETRRGLRFQWYRVKHRFGIVLGGLLAAGVVFYCSNTITTIEISGNETVTKASISAVLSQVGVKTGAFLPMLNLRLCELDVRLEIPALDWVGIRHTGGRVVVDVTEVTERPRLLPDHIPSNYVSTKNAFLETVRCYDGDIVKDTGEAVGVGDIILSGVREDEFGSITLHHAHGMAIGVYEETVTLRQPYVEEQRSEGAPITRKRFLLFGHSLPLYVGEPAVSDYAYQETESPFQLLGRTLPLGLRHSTYTPYTYEIKEYTKDEAELLLRQQQTRYEAAVYANCEILERDLRQSDSENGLTCQISYRIRGEIGAIREIFIK